MRRRAFTALLVTVCSVAFGAACNNILGVDQDYVVGDPFGAGGAGAGGSDTIACAEVTDCPPPPDGCQTSICLAGACGFVPAAAGAAVAQQVAGDCLVQVCDGAGNTASQNDDADLPDDSSSCTEDLCNSGVAEHLPLALGTACSGGSNGVCDDAGMCVECNAIADCTSLPPDDECQQRSCAMGSCTPQFTAAGTAVTLQTTGDCKVNACDGAGSSQQDNDDGDVPDDGNDCTQDVCTAGVPSNPNEAMGTVCAAGQCNDMGQCTGCTMPSDCGTDTFCRVRTCVATVCGFTFTAAGTALPGAQQVAADCLELQCDGNGGVQAVPSATDLPADDGNECTADSCQNGVAVHPPLPLDSVCSQGGVVCDGNGACVACNSPGQCPDQGTVCQSATCMANSCGLMNTPDDALAPAGSQTDGDCSVVLCDGVGGTKTNADANDLPDDLNDCTDDVCTGTTPSNPPTMAGTACGTAGTCDGAGNCVGCGVAPAAPGGGACPAICDDCTGNICRIDCTQAKCRKTTVDCPAGYACDVRCVGTAVCDSSILNCPDTYACDVQCQGSDACFGVDVKCGSGPCSLTCVSGAFHCQGAKLACGSDACTEICNGSYDPMTTCGDSCSCTEC
jgi:hypothetical protein